MPGVALGLFAAAGGPSFAANLGSTSSAPAAVPYVPPLYDWTGFYFGGRAGWMPPAGADPSAALLPGRAPTGFLPGNQVGYNYQLGAFVFGIEGGLSFTDARGPARALGAEVGTRPEWLATVTGRLGLAWDRMLLYTRGGAAVAETSFSAPLPSPLEAKDLRTGWTVGAGAEYALWDNWSLRAEYNYIDLGTRTVRGTLAAGAAPTQDGLTAHMIRLGANYRFSWR